MHRKTSIISTSSTDSARVSGRSSASSVICVAICVMMLIVGASLSRIFTRDVSTETAINPRRDDQSLASLERIHPEISSEYPSLGMIPMDSSGAPPRGPFVPTLHRTTSSSAATHSASTTSHSTISSTQKTSQTTPSTTHSTSIHPSTSHSASSSSSPKPSSRPSTSMPKPEASTGASKGSGSGQGLGTGSGTNSAPGKFNYHSFDPCKFSPQELTGAGLPLMPEKNNQIYPQETSPQTWDAECNYTSSSGNPRWYLAINKLRYKGKPDNFDWMEMGYFSGIDFDLNNWTTAVKGHRAVVQETIFRRTIYHLFSLSEQGTVCRVCVSPGVEYDFADRSGLTPTRQLCNQLIRFLSEKVY